MKHISNNFSLNFMWVILMTTVFFSCRKEFLEVSPQDRISENALWSSKANADLFLNDMYADLPDIHVWRQGTSAEDAEENFSDNSMNGVEWRYSRAVYAKSLYTPSNAPNHWFWHNSIRKANVFIENITNSGMDNSWKKERLAEARFLRALFYKMLWIHYGGVPVITTVQNRETDGDAIYQARNTSDEVYQFITSELTAIAPDLLLVPEAGRASRGAALTLKAWCDLYQASPLNNTSNENARWVIAAAANKEVMNLGVYGLFPDYANMFFEQNNGNVETILAKKHIGGTALGGLYIVEATIPYYRETFAGDGSYTPTQELVDEYSMANGLVITDPASGYDPQNPYENREKRFYQTVIYNGSVWRDDTVKTWVGSNSKNSLDKASASEAGNTGYYLRKGLDTKYSQNWFKTSSQDYIIFRYAEVLLGYAEAQNEASGPDASIYEAINKVRNRSDLPNLQVGLSKDQMRVAIYRERRVELAFEEKRWLDLRRWKIAVQKLNGSLHAMEITKANGQFKYTVIPAPSGERIFYEKNYLLPIPQSALDRNEKLTQNPGY